MNDPLAAADRAAKAAAAQAEVQRRAARAHKAEEWFDIFVSVTRSGVAAVGQDTGEASAMAAVDERWKDFEPSFVRVRQAFKAQGLELNEGIEVEGPDTVTGPTGFPTLSWPRGTWCDLTWTDGSVLKFKGRDALVAACFLMWWVGFNQVHVQEHGGIVGGQKSRIVDPNSNEYLDYLQTKQRELNGQ